MLLSLFKMNRRLLKLLGLCALASSVVFAGALLAPRVAAAQAAGFTDVPESHSYHVQIETLAQLGIIAGFSDGTFRPQDPVTRQQFAKMVILAMRITVSEDDKCAFIDVKKSSDLELYPDNFVAAAAREKIVTGYQGPSGPYFKPDASITLAQMITMGTRACVRPLWVPPDSYKSAWGNFDSVHSVIARVAQYNGLLRELAPAGLKSLSPWGKATRGEAAALLFNVMGTDTAGLNGRFLGTSDDLVKMFRDATNGNDGKFSIPLPDLAKLYIKYGKRFGIRADMAWAQMIHETGYGQYGGDVSPAAEQHGGHRGYGRRGARQLVQDRGARRHRAVRPPGLVSLPRSRIRSLLRPGHPACRRAHHDAGDPRHFVQPEGSPHKANVRTVNDLSGKWAVGPNYGSAIQTLASKIPVTCGLW